MESATEGVVTDTRLGTVLSLPVYTALGTSPRGLGPAEAAARLDRYGPNELPPHHRRPIAFRFFQQFTDLFAVLPIVAALLTLTAYLVQIPHDVGNLQLTEAGEDRRQQGYACSFRAALSGDARDQEAVSRAYMPVA